MSNNITITDDVDDETRKQDNDVVELCNLGKREQQQQQQQEQSNQQQQRPLNAYQEASCWSRLVFTWPYPLLKLGTERPLEDSDFADVLREDSSEYNRDYFWTLWNAECELCQQKNESQMNEKETTNGESETEQSQQQKQNQQQQQQYHPSLHRALAKDFFTSTWFIQPMMMVGATARVVQAIVLGYFIESFQEFDNGQAALSAASSSDAAVAVQTRQQLNHENRGYLWAGLIVICAVLVLFEHHHVFFFTWRKGMQYRIACIAAIHEKALRLSSTHQDTSASYGRIMNLASNDVERFILASLFVNHLFWAPVQSIAILGTGYWLLGPAFAAGFAVLIVVFVPLQFWLSGQFAHFRTKIASITDQRVTFVSQAVRGARVMKMSGYEPRFLERIQSIRQREVGQIIQANSLKALNEALFFSTNAVITVIIFLFHVFVMNSTLVPGDVFTVFTLINVLQLEMTKHLSLGIMGVSEVFVSIRRIQNFLEFPELPRENEQQQQQAQAVTENENNNDNNGNSTVDAVISMKEVVCHWNEVKAASSSVAGGEDEMGSSVHSRKSSNASIRKLSTSYEAATTGGEEEDSAAESSLVVALDNVTVDFAKGQLTAVIGTVGSGKSALLQAIVQELPVSSGTITRRQYQTLAYAAQDPWVMDGTVKENIVMGLDYNESWYQQVVTACALIIDFQQLREGDQTIVGDRGVQLSGGQRARVGLARAIYRNADLLIVDDPLSAVDTRVGRQIFQEALLGLAVRRGKSVILATHQHQYVNNNQYCTCVLMTSGSLTCIGTYEDCVKASDGKLTAHAADDSVDNLAGDGEGNVTPLKTNNNTTASPIQDSTKDGEESIENDDDNKKNNSSNDNKEISKQGIVDSGTYLKYIQALGGLWVAFFLFVIFSVSQALVLATIAFTGRWSRRPPENQKDIDMVKILVGLSIGVMFMAVFRAFLSFSLTIKASQRLHDKMAQAVLRAKIEFFDTNPLGRIMNRFSADVGSNDDLLPPTLFDFFVIAFMVLGAMITTIVTLPFALIAVPPLCWYFANVRSTFITSSREMKRLEGLARSPIFAIISESLGGIATIRANDSVEFFKQKFKEAHDTHSRAFFGFIAASRWVGFRMDSIVCVFLSLVCFLSVLFQTQGWFNADPDVLGISISMLLQLAGMFQWCIRQSAECVNQMVSVERVLAFGELEPEAPLEKEVDQPLMDSGWPALGAVEFDDYSVRYRPSLPLVLDKVSFKIPPNSRVGIVGRTGSGKSTIVQTLFRLLEAERGRIMIDNQDISKLGLHALRTKISVIPQVPTLFSGCTVRENLDLFGLHSDESLHRVLDACHLGPLINEIPNGMDSMVAENGSNFSVGQRQLLCLARAILAENRILILDEATASVDRRTDQLLQETLQKTFSEGTIIAVAHRLDTVIDNDFVLVMGHGRVLEFGKPADLIRNGGSFASMIEDTGETMSQDLKSRAFLKEQEKKVN